MSKEFPKQAYLLQEMIRKAGIPIEGQCWFVAGGACTSVFSAEPIRDLDIFFPCELDFAELRKTVEAKKEAGGLGAKPVFITDNALSYVLDGIRVQLIRKLFGSPAQVIRKFDFSVCMAAWNPRKDSFTLDPSFLPHLASRTLVYNTEGEYPIASMYRIRKYLKRGYSISGVEIMKIALRVNSLKIDSYKDLKEQLEGIDTLVLKDLTDQLNGCAEKQYDFGEFLLMAEQTLEKLYEIEER
jgi:hypothetical protein